MAAATKNRPTSKKVVHYIVLAMAADTVMYGGTAGASDASGNGVPVTAATGLKIWGRVRKTADNTGGSAGAQNVTIDFEREVTVYLYANDTGTPLTRADIGTSPHWLDNQTVTAVDTDNSQGGTVWDVTAEGVWIFF